jgi:dipeptidyl aminopeptidase/acylaminoacyl peptidase
VHLGRDGAARLVYLRRMLSRRPTPILAAGLLASAACGAPPEPVMPPPASCPSSAATDASSAPLASAAAAPPAAPTSSYDKPPAAVLDVLHAPSPPGVALNPTRDVAVLVTWEDYPPIARVAEPFLKLAGVRIEPKNHGLHSTPGGYGIAPCARALVLVRVSDGKETKVALPPGACVDWPTWSADGTRFVFRNTTAEAVELWLGDATTGEVRRVPKVRLNPMFGSPVRWLPDQKTLLVKLVPEGQGAPPPAPPVPPGPNIQETRGDKGASSTYEARDLLRTAHDEALFDHFAASRLATVDVASSAITTIGAVAPLWDASPAPDGEHLLVQTLEKPWSRVVTAGRFARRIEVWDRKGKVVHAVAKIPVAERVPIHGVRTGPRDFDWRPTEPATLVWAEALDGGDWNAKVPARDKVMLQRAPFAGAPVEIARLEQRYAGLSFTEDPRVALLGEYDENRHWTRTFVVDLDDPAKKPKKLWDLSTDEHYADPGSPVRKVLPNGEWVVKKQGDTIWLSGTGSSPDGDRPFLDRLDLATGKSERLFRSEKTALERFVAFADPAATTLLTWHQSQKDVPNLFARTLGAKVTNPQAGEPAWTSTPRAITHVPDPAPAVRAIQKRLVKYKRKDGVELSFTLYTPPGYKEGTRLPTILHAYPLDYAEASKAGQVTGSEQRFTTLRNESLVLLAGYALIKDAAFPVVGDPKKAYDTYLDQLVMDAKAAVDKAVELGVADPERIGVTGHSHGALMTVNLLAHTDLFRAGVATSGSYNKTLTAFGFQNERRTVWQAPDVYVKVSPFFAVDKLKLPLLVMHGEDDANPGTTPLQAEKLYEAIRGNGGTARLVMLPHEPHWYSAMESNEQLLYEMIRWFDMYVKEAKPREKRR